MYVQMPSHLRPSSNLVREMYSSSRHSLGIYRAVVVSARYSPSSRAASAPLTSISPRLLSAVAAVVSAHPMLRVGITGDDGNEPRYTHIPRMDLLEHVSVETVSCASEAELNHTVAAIQARRHNILWESLATRAPWHLTLVRNEQGGGEGEQEDCEDIVFAFHHALLDGTSGRKFHEHLLAALDDVDATSSSSSSSSVLSFPEPPVLPEAQEVAIKFTLGPLFMLSVLWGEYGPKALKSAPPPPVWGGEPISFARPYVTRLRPVDVSPAQTAILLAACRAHKTTLTGLFHGLALACFTKLLPSSDDGTITFNGATPMGLAKYMQGSVDAALRDTLRVLVGDHSHDFSAEDTSAMRAAVRSGGGLDDLVWKTAARVRAELVEQAQHKRMTHNNIIAMLKYVSDWRQFHNARDGTARTHSWMVSNVGALEERARGSTQKTQQVTRVMFSNGALVTSAAVGINVASAPGGHLTAALSWQEGVVGEDLVDGLAEGLEGLVSRFCERGVWTFA